MTGRRGDSSGLHFTIGSAVGHDSPNNLDLSEDLALVKATLLYADGARLCSVGASVLSGFAEYAEASTEERAKLVVKFLPQLQPSMTRDEIYFFEAVVGLHGTRLKRRIPKRTRNEILGMVKVQEGELRDMVVEQHSAAGIEGLREAVKSGVLEVHSFRETSAEAIFAAMLRGRGSLLAGVDLVDVLVEYIDLVSGTVEDGSTYPLFDDLTGDFVTEAIRAGLITTSDTSTARGRYGRLAGDLLRRLPLFETVKLSDVLVIRRELEAPLRGFRLAVADFSRQFSSAGWEPGFPDEAAVKALIDRRNDLKAIEKNQLYFYYRAGTALAERLQKLEQRLYRPGRRRRHEPRSKLAGLQAQRKELEGALRAARNRQETIEEFERAWP